MAKIYKWRTNFSYQNDPDPRNRLSYGITPSNYDAWQTEDAGDTDSNDTQYWYRDSNMLTGGYYVDANSSEVRYTVHQEWTTSVDNSNNLTITITTIIRSIERRDIQGTDSNTPGRIIDVYKEIGGQSLIHLTDYQVATAHTLSGEVNLGTQTFTLEPGRDATTNSLFIHNQTDGGSSYDDIWAGVQFMNPLPADYRPGATLDTNTSIWKSHNRTNGACHVLSNTGSMTWQECRTVDGDSGGRGNPPLILTAADANSWRNQKKLGKE